MSKRTRPTFSPEFRLEAAQAGGVALLIDSKSERVAEWYANYSAIPLLDAQFYHSKR